MGIRTVPRPLLALVRDAYETEMGIWIPQSHSQNLVPLCYLLSPLHETLLMFCAALMTRLLYDLRSHTLNLYSTL